MPRRSGGTAADSRVSVSGITIARADALHGAGGDQRVDAGREGRAAEARGEDAEADGEHAPAAEAVTERGAEHQQDGEGEGVGVHRPLQVLERAAEVLADGRAARW